MNKKDYMKPSMMVVKIQAHRILTISKDLGVHNEVSSQYSYSRGCNWDDEDEE